MSQMTVLKAVLQALGAVLVAILPLLFVGPLGFSEIVNVIVVAIGAFVVWNTKNYPRWRYGKLLASGAATVTTVLVDIASHYAFGDVSAQQWWQLALALLTTVAVGLAPNGGYVSTDATQDSGPRVA